MTFKKSELTFEEGFLGVQAKMAEVILKNVLIGIKQLKLLKKT